MYTRLLFTSILLICGSGLFAQSSNDSTKEDLSRIFVTEQVKPSFIGGIDSLNNFLNLEVNTYGATDGERSIVKFIVSSKGNIYQVSGVNLSFGKSLVRALLKSSGQWKGGFQNGRYVNAICTISITFYNNRIEAVMR